MKKRSSRKNRLAALISISLAALVPVSALPGAASDEPEAAAGYYLCGDTYTDDDVESSDAGELAKYLAHLRTLDETQMTASDVDFNGLLNVSDVVGILDWVAGRNIESRTGDYIKLDGTADDVYLPDDFTLAGAVSDGSYMTFAEEQPGETLILKLFADIPGTYKLRIGYSNGTAGDKSLYVTVNGSEDAYTANFPATASWDDTSTAYCLVKLAEGENTIRLISPGTEGSPRVYSLTACRTVMMPPSPSELPVTPLTPDDEETTQTTEDTESTQPPTQEPTESAPVYYFAVDSEYANADPETTNEGFAGEAYLNYYNSTDSYNIWSVDVPEDGRYKITFRYANGTPDSRNMNIYINSEGAESDSFYTAKFPGTGEWTDWAETSIVAALTAGTNTVKAVSATENGGPNMDYITVEPVDEPLSELTKPKTGRQVEKLNRGVSAANSGSGVLVSWRILATDDPSTRFRLYKNGETPPLYEGSLTDPPCYFDASGTASDTYTVDTYVNGEMTEFVCASINLGTKNSGQSGAYFDIPLDKPSDLTMPDNTTCSYSANDASVGDVDGDGEYEIILKWDPSNSQDNSKNGYTGNVYLDCYKLSGEKLWRIDLGVNIRAGAHYTQFMVYDYDGDGMAELVCKTADGTKDGAGNVIGDATADYRTSAGRILSGPEYLTLFDGRTGAALDTIDYKPSRGKVDDWGDAYGNRVDRFTAATAYLDGKTPSVVMCRGYYTRMSATAYDVVDKKLKERWAFDTGHNSAAAGYGDGNHNCMPADVDLDGKDELVMGSAVIDDDGTLLYTSGLGHGDAMHVGDLDPGNPGLEIFMCHEDGPDYGVSLRDGETGEILFREKGGSDTGRCIADNFIAGNDSAELCGIHNSVVYDTSGTKVCDWSEITKWGQNSAVYWTDVLERGTLDRTMIDQHGKGRVFTGDGVSYNNSTKSNASLTCDLFGDWREELIFPTYDSTALRVFGTTFETQYPIYTLMHNTQYRAQVAGQNVAYNQPPHTDYFLGTGYDLPEAPRVYAAE